jgi:hypothetical protein
MDHVCRPVEVPGRSRFLLLYVPLVVYEKEELRLHELKVDTPGVDPVAI